MANWYVRPSGGSYGAEDGSSYADAWNGLTNIVWGGAGVVAGDTLYIDGTHTTGLTLTANGSVGNFINIRPYSEGSASIITNNVTCIVVSSRSYLSVDGLYLERQNATTGAVVGISGTNPNNISVTNNEIIGGRGVQIVSSVAGNDVTYITITDNDIHNCDESGIFINYGNATTPAGLRNLTISNNAIYSNAGGGIKMNSTNRSVAGNEAYGITITGNSVYENVGIGLLLFDITTDATTPMRSVISNNTVYSNCSGATAGNMQLGGVDNAVVKSNEVYDAKSTGIDGVGLFLDVDGGGNGCTGCIVAGNYIHDNVTTSTAHGAGGIHVYRSSGNLVYGNIFVGNNNGIVVGGAESTTNTIDNNTVVNSINDNLLIRNSAGANTVRNNVLYGGTRGMVVDSATAPTETNNCVYGAGTNFTGLTKDASDIELDPLFISTTNYRLRQGSPCRSQGVFTSFTSRDYRGRPFNIPPAIGAYAPSRNDPANTRTIRS